MKNSFLDNSQLECFELNKNTYQLRNQNNLVEAFFPSGLIQKIRNTSKQVNNLVL